MAIDYDKYIYSTGTHYIANSGKDENSAYHGGKAGDQQKISDSRVLIQKGEYRRCNAGEMQAPDGGGRRHKVRQTCSQGS